MANLKTAGHADINGIKMYYEIHGEGTIPLVLMHGGGSTLNSTFGRILPLLARNGKVIGLELQAHGRTTDRDAPESFEQDADDVAALLNYLKVDKANILGFSNGGTTTLQIAIRYPHLLNKIIVVAGSYKRDGFIPGFFDFMQHATIDNMPKLLKDAFLKLTPDEALLQNMFEKDKARMITFKDYADADISGIKAPALFMASAGDVVTMEHTLAMYNLIPGAELVVLLAKHGGILGAIEAELKKDSKLPEMTASLIDEFLNA